MRKERVVVGLDVGTTKVVALVGNVVLVAVFAVALIDVTDVLDHIAVAIGIRLAIIGDVVFVAVAADTEFDVALVG